jgi:HEPN superfamily AbiU2-like protein
MVTVFGPKSRYKSRRFEELVMIDPRRVLNEFYNLCVEARCDFDLYRSRFENDPKKMTLCVDYAPYFFNDFGRILTRFLVLHVCRLTDPAGSGSKSNLTTNYVLENLAWPSAVQANLREYNDQLMVLSLRPMHGGQASQ